MNVLKIAVLSILCLSGFQFFLSTETNSYVGRESEGEWRNQASERIEKIRKADIAVFVKNTDNTPVDAVNVNVRMKKHTFAFGSAVGAMELMGDDENSVEYRRKVNKLYNKVVLENDLKHWPWVYGKTNPPGSKYIIGQTFEALEWLNENNIKVRGHNVAGGGFEYYEKYGMHKDRPDAFSDFLFSHIREKVAAVGNLVSEWDVINHPVRWDKNLANIFGSQIYLDIFKLTKTLNPNIKLYINEGNILRTTNDSHITRTDYEELIQYLVKHDAPLDGIGFMGHFSKDTLTPPKELINILDRFARFGLPLQITEFDVRFFKKAKNYNLSDIELKLQADYTKDFFLAMFSHPSVEGIIMWGFWEGRHWNPPAALYRMDWSIKPNGQAWKDLVFNEWWTDEKGVTDENGEYHTRGFLGDYEIEVRFDDKVKVIPFKLPKEGKRVEVVLD